MIKPYQIDYAVYKAAKSLGIDPWDQPFNVRINPRDWNEIIDGLSPGARAKGAYPNGSPEMTGTIRGKKTNHPFSIIPSDSIPPGSVEVEFVCLPT